MQYFLVLVLALAPAFAFAKERKSSGASTAPAMSRGPDCITIAIEGRSDGECAQERDTDLCSGLKLALGNSLKKEYCFARAGEGCLEYGYKKNSQTQWVAVASGHLSAFTQCVRQQYGHDDTSGLKEALADPNFLRRLESLQDGASAYGLREASLLRRVLEGETFSEVLQASPVWQYLSQSEQQHFRLAAETPMPIPERPEDGAGGEALAQGRGWKRGGGFLGKPTGVTEGMASGVVVESEHSMKAVYPARAPAAETGASGLYVRKLKHNPYSLGLDLSLFDRVSTVYQKRSPALRGVNDFISNVPRREPRDVREMIEMGRPAEI